MIDIPCWSQKPNKQVEFQRLSTNKLSNEVGDFPNRRANLILKPPPQSQPDLDFLDWRPRHAKLDNQLLQFTKTASIFQKCKEKANDLQQSYPPQINQLDQDHRVKGKLNKKGKRDGQNIRTYARYDSVIQALEQELLVHKIIPTPDDKKMLDQFQMKSKRSLERYFFYLLLAKRQNKLQNLLPGLKQKIRTKIQEKVGHRTSQFLKNLQNCVQRYLEAAEKLLKSQNIEQARMAFSVAYLNDLNEHENDKRPHHNKIKGINKCMQIYRIIMKTDKWATVNKQQFSLDQSKNPLKSTPQQKINKSQHLCKSEGLKINLIESPKNHKRKQTKYEDQSFIANESDLLQNLNQKKKKIGVKNKKQDDRDIQKYAKFDIVSESSLEFLKIQKLHKNIPEICKKLSQRSLHFFFVILALIQKEKKDGQFLIHLENNYERKVQKRYSQRSQYFRQRLHQSFFNLIQATRALFNGFLDQALDIAYQVKSDKKTHPAKASQQKKCREIYQAIRSAFEGNGQDSKFRLQLLIQNDKGHRSQLIKQIKSPSIKSIVQMQAQRQKQEFCKNIVQNAKINPQVQKQIENELQADQKMEEEGNGKQNIQTLERQKTLQLLNILVPIPHRITQVYSQPRID